MHHFIVKLARFMALLGGLVLIALIVMTCASILGRSMTTISNAEWLTSQFPSISAFLINSGIGPINGDYEILEAGVALAIFAFLPICQLRGGHAAVEVFTGFLPPRFNQALIAFWEIMLALAIVLISWRLSAGLLSKINNGETSFLLQFPIWWSYAASFAASVMAAVVAVYCAWSRTKSAITGQPDLIGLEGGAH